MDGKQAGQWPSRTRIGHPCLHLFIYTILTKDINVCYSDGEYSSATNNETTLKYGTNRCSIALRHDLLHDSRRAKADLSLIKAH